MNRRLSALILGTLGATLLVAGPSGERSQASSIDPVAVDRYIARLSETVPRPATAALATEPPEDPKLAKSAARLDRAEPVVGAVLAVVR